MDDCQVAIIINRRQVLALFRATGTAVLVIGCTSKKPSSAQSSSVKAALPGCIVSPLMRDRVMQQLCEWRKQGLIIPSQTSKKALNEQSAFLDFIWLQIIF